MAKDLNRSISCTHGCRHDIPYMVKLVLPKKPDTFMRDERGPKAPPTSNTACSLESMGDKR
ncbi:hypothetical protein QQP08_003428 [Theobroma cacao]|nr:hypothetical protein QQP08_003428 [Theobroma cacao]